jgi:HAD superfamily hydrolase (TIGR01490 family)
VTPRKTAAFYDMDGTLIRGNVTDHYLYFAKTDPDLASRFGRLAELAIKGPYFWAVDRIDRRTFNEVFYRCYAGLSEDRLTVLGEELFEKVLKKKMYPGARRLIDGDRALGRELVLLSGAIEQVAWPVARFLGIPTVFASRLEFGKNNLATGKLLPPVMAGPEKSLWVRRFSEERGIDLEDSTAYADDAADLPLLSCVGRPVAVNPDLRLTATARSHRWPILKLDDSQSLIERAITGARTALDVGRDLADRAIAEGEARWSERDEVLDKAKRVLGTVGDLAAKARDAAHDAVQAAAKDSPEKAPDSARESGKRA